VGAELQPGDPSRIGPYRLVEVLGSGGMGRVYLGRSAAGRHVAVKVIRAELAADPEFRIRFRREVAAARLVNGLYTALVVDADTDGRVPWLATAYINAPSLADAVLDSGPLPPASLRALAAGLAEGLSAIHAAGLVHRDLKPSNVLLAADGPRLIDFGIARAAEATSLTGTNIVVGSPGYLSPEQAEPNREVGPASDVFSLGAVLCYAAIGRGPWGTGSTAALIYRVVHSEPSIDDVPDEIRSLVARCVVKTPARRPTAADILAELGDPELVSGWLAESGIDGVSGPAPTVTADRIVTVAPSTTAQPPGRIAAGSATPLDYRAEAAAQLESGPALEATSSGPPPAATTASSDATGQGVSSGVNTVTGSGTPVPLADSSGRHLDTRSLVRRRRRRRSVWAVAVAVVAAAAVTVPLLVTQALSGPGTTTTHTPSPSPRSPSSRSPSPSPPPALVGVYSGSQYGFMNPNSIAADGRHVWVLNGGNDSVTELSAPTGAWVKTLPAGIYRFKATFNDTAGIIDDGTNVWVGNENSVTEISTGNGSLVRTLQVPVSVDIHGWYTTLVRAGAQLWAASPDTCRPYCVSASDTGFYASIIEFNASNGSYVRAVSRNTTQTPIALASDGAYIWLVGSDIHGSRTAGSVTELNASDGHLQWSVPATIYYNSQATTYDSIAYADGRLWVANGESVTELNASNGKLIGVLSGAQYQFNQPAVIAAAGTHVFVVNIGGNSVTEIDARTGALVHTLSAARYHFDNPTGIAVVGNRAWILNSPSSSAGSVVELAL